MKRGVMSYGTTASSAPGRDGRAPLVSPSRMRCYFAAGAQRAATISICLRTRSTASRSSSGG